MSKRLSSKVAHSQSPVDRVCEMACIISLHKKRGFSRKYYIASLRSFHTTANLLLISAYATV